MKKQTKTTKGKRTPTSSRTTTRTERWEPQHGDAICIRTVTHYHVGQYDGEVMLGRSPMLALSRAAWVADTGRFSTFLKSGQANEVEPFDGPCLVNPGSIINIAPWRHTLLEVVK